MRNNLEVKISLKSIYCHDEADGWGNAEPYLWVLFFKIDGETIRFGDRLSLEGAATIERRNGGHGNLLNEDVAAGDNVAIPSGLGEWSTILVPIPLTEGAKRVVSGFDNNIRDFAGTIGVLCILMEEDTLSDSSILAGYDALVSTFTNELNREISAINAFNRQINEDTIKNAVSNAVEGAIRNDLSILQSIWTWVLGADQQIGQRTFKFDHDQLFPKSPTPEDFNIKIIPLNQRWSGGAGDWEIHGEISIKGIPNFADPPPSTVLETTPNLKGVEVFEDWKYNTETIQPTNRLLRVRKEKFGLGSWDLLGFIVSTIPSMVDPITGRIIPPRTIQLPSVRPKTISSVKVGEGYIAVLYDRSLAEKAQAKSITLKQNTSIMPPEWNDRAMSLEVLTTPRVR